MNAAFVVDMTESVCCRRSISTRRRPPHNPVLVLIIVLIQFGGKGIR